VPVLVAWSLHWRRSPDWRWPVVSNELRHQHSRMLKRHTSRAPEDGFLCATCNVAIITHRDCDLNSSVAIPTAVAWGPRLEPLHPIVERLAAMLVPIAPYGLVGEVAGLGPLLGAIDEVVSVHATVGGDVSESLLDDPPSDWAKDLCAAKLDPALMADASAHQNAIGRRCAARPPAEGVAAALAHRRPA
jgi:hypothetical protein